LLSISRHFGGWVGWNLLGEKSDQVSRTIMRQARRAGISGSQRRAEKPAKQPGKTPVIFFTADVRPTGRKADNVWFLFMKSEAGQRRCSCSKGGQMAFKMLFKCRLYRSDIGQIPPIYGWENHVQKENNNGTINS
jgi:hypothetical protein